MTSDRTTADRPNADRTSPDRRDDLHRQRRRRVGRRGGAGVVGFVSAVAVSLGAVASAHGGAGSMTLVSYTPSGSTAQVVVQVAYTGDGHPVEDATVTVAGENTAGTALTPVTLASTDTAGQYAGVVQYPAPGEWSLRVTSVEPVTSLTLAETVDAPQVTVESPELLTGGTASPAAPGEASATGDPSAPGETVAPGPVISPAPEPAADEASGGAPTWVWILAVGAAVVSVVIGVAFVMNGSRQGPID